MEDLNWIKSSNGEFEDIIREDNDGVADFVIEDTMVEEEGLKEEVKEQTSRPKKRVLVLPVISHMPLFLRQAFKDPQAGVKPPGVWKTLLGVISQVRTTNNLQRFVGHG
ncbi:hypothetical protein POM88_037118 [Heracleum sosnowskyi]|uniref:Uncharacterized protein n=1 Tax=Heracleum sosnowskyi TaxID=360622 RepID=A0AAD8MEZ3_9APIA|nr:hypothetical protein POM88_037118 [Heracleum sosnowskyi]